MCCTSAQGCRLQWYAKLLTLPLVDICFQCYMLLQAVTIDCNVAICSNTHWFSDIPQISTQYFLFHLFNSAHSAFFQINSNQHTVLVTILFHVLLQVRLRHGSRSKADFPRPPREEEVGLHACKDAMYLYIKINICPCMHIAHICHDNRTLLTTTSFPICFFQWCRTLAMLWKSWLPKQRCSAFMLHFHHVSQASNNCCTPCRTWIAPWSQPALQPSHPIQVHQE